MNGRKCADGRHVDGSGALSLGEGRYSIMANYIDYAVSYVHKFHSVVPCGAWTYTNNDGEEVDMWKVPLIKNWSQEPIATEAQVRRCYSNYMNRYNKIPGIGVATGQICGGYIVVDLDRKQEKGVDGYEVLRDWQRDNGVELPETWTVITGGGGYHLWFKTDKAIRGYKNTDLGVDLRADGNFIVVPPSLHKSGKRYEWEIDLSPRDIECAEANEDVLQFIEYCRPSGSEYADSNEGIVRTRRENAGARKMHLPEEIPKGHRHEKLVSLIGTLNRLGVTDEGIELLIRHENEIKCKPPMTEQELQKEIFSAIFTFPKGIPAEKWQDREAWIRENNAQIDREARAARCLQRARRS